MKTEPAQEIQSLIAVRFSLDKPTALQNISLMGCCEEHDDWYKAYRTITWLEFGEILLQPEQGGLDATDFIGIRPIAYYYFAPGILWAVTESILRYQEIAYHLWDWLRDLHGTKSRQPTYHHELAEQFNQAQKELVAKCLELANTIHLETEGYRDRHIDWSLSSVWVT
ncbi:MAG: hypothetical protein JNM09_12105 [Blastocatellia bacterium]|nr:hypothetical protein [Blastocatellia bacterium]